MIDKTSNDTYPEAEIPVCERRLLLKGQTALVTGGSSGIGLAIAEELSAAGAHVVINFLKGQDRAEATAQKLSNRGPECIALQGDVSCEKDVRALFKKTVKKFGRLDILVNNAGIQKDAPFDTMSLSDWNAVIGVNLTGQFLCAREAVRQFKKQGIDKKRSCAAGKIICISSVHEVIPWAGHVNYAASKGGVMLMMKSLAQEVAPHRIRVNSIAPGAIKTAINKKAWDTQNARKELLKLIPYNRIGETEDIGRAAVWLASDESDYVHGVTLFVDGGMTLYPGFETGG